MDIKIEGTVLLNSYNISNILLFVHFKAGSNIETLYIATQNSLQKPTFGNFEGQCRLAEALVDVPATDAVCLKFVSFILICE